MSRIFVSYRRDDTQGEAGHLLADLRRRFGGDRVFMDIAAIGPGEEFGPVIERAIADCSVVLVLIGRNWLDARDAQGRRRLDDANDWVRLEVEAALQGSRLVVPVLVQGATLPVEAALPESMRALARRNAHEVSARRWDYDFDGLAKTLASALGIAEPPSTGHSALAPAATRHGPAPRWLGTALAVVAIAAGLGLAAYFLRGDRAPVADKPEVATAPKTFAPSQPSLFSAAGKRDTVSPATPTGDFEKRYEYMVFARLSSDFAAEPGLTDTQLRRLDWTRDAACPLDDARCRQAAERKVSETLETICRRKVPAVAASASSTVRLKTDIDFQTCVQSMRTVMLDESSERGKDALRSIKTDPPKAAGAPAS